MPRPRRLPTVLTRADVVYLSPADNAAGPVWSRPHDANRTVMTVLCQEGLPCLPQRFGSCLLLVMV
jgi:hypothetical protein